MEYPDNLKYTKEHEWVIESEGMVIVGITDYAQDALGDVVFVELPEVGSEVKAGEPFGVVESVKSVSDLYAPITGKVVEINNGLEDEPELVNNSPFDEGWMIKIEVYDESELDDLLSSSDYEEYVKSL
ncbi:MAG: glycine cleavage system protein GcvH [Nitrospinota bacterium]|nr:glycine cleavage system protein GcvH [Nitrospinota bacterium]